MVCFIDNRVITKTIKGSMVEWDNNQDTQHPCMHTVGRLDLKQLYITHGVYSKSSNDWPKSVATNSIIITSIVVTIKAFLHGNRV